MKILTILVFLFLLADASVLSAQDYTTYHQQVIKAENLIADKKHTDALLMYENIFSSYDFVFVKDYQVATQLALLVNDVQKATHYLKKGMAAGWSIKSIKQNKFLAKLRKEPVWKSIRKEYPSLRKQYENGFDQQVRKQVKKMFARDQWKALGALFTFTPKKQDRYAERRFAPHSERQMAEFTRILQKKGYPGEKFIGNNYWMATIMSHHNSISTAYVQKDTLYQFLKPALLIAISEGKMSPWEFAMIDDWYLAVKSNRTETGYGYMNSPARAELSQVNELRNKIGLNSVETRNSLIDIEN
ncbi:hypothetical protein GXP67_26070 [Rhodocytophaga rosea]|uniref:DUF4034 domain-containing protein n=1 Tax=Rhodocytophaga rosea TaxID=2704465 RepID=A0A6C0GP94_9BACT|nr:hypothetical protein [Rhodocytophaga rosea]QHT69866.1 hypothetical protein GXP67_26070 [Rhodocytophaga rosea]